MLTTQKLSGLGGQDGQLVSKKSKHSGTCMIPALRELRREKQELEATLGDLVGCSLQEAFSP